MKKIFYVKGLSCKKCKQRIFDSLSSLDSVKSIKIKVDTGKVIFESEKEIPDSILAEKVSAAGEYLFSLEKPKLILVIKKKNKEILSTIFDLTFYSYTIIFKYNITSPFHLDDVYAVLYGFFLFSFRRHKVYQS